MKLGNSNGDSFRLTIVGYEFPPGYEFKHVEPDEEDEDDDNAEWLMIRGEVRIADREWEFVHPCLDTEDVQELIDWLTLIASNAPSVPIDIAFKEPLLMFKRIDATTIRMFFNLEARPPGAPTAHHWSEDVFLDIDASPAALKPAIANLTKQLARFPPFRC